MVMDNESSFEEKVALCPPAMQAVIEDFQMVEPRERLEYLVEYSMELPDLPERLHHLRDQMEQVHECQSPVLLYTEIEDGIVHFFLEIPPEAPTVRGFAGALLEGFEGAASAEVLATPDDLYRLLGLHQALTPQRLRGLHALTVYMKRQVARRIEAT